MSNKTREKQPDATASAHKRHPVHLLLGSILLLFGVLAVIGGVQALLNDDRRLFAPKGILTVEVADTNEERRIGLSNRESLSENRGMLFVFDTLSVEHCFWMKDTTLSLDIVWLDDQKRIIDVQENTEPLSLESLCPRTKAQYVIEVNAGQAQALGLTVGEQVRF